MRRIALVLGAFALIAAAPPQTVSSRQEPGFAPSDEPCLAEPVFAFFLEEPTQEPAGPRSWSDCTADEARAAIQRQCALDERPGSIAHEMCLSRRERIDAGRRAVQTAEDRPLAGTTRHAADQACRGQMWRRPGETQSACIERLVSTDALSQPLPEGRQPTDPRCRQETRVDPDGRSRSYSVNCFVGDESLRDETQRLRDSLRPQ